MKTRTITLTICTLTALATPAFAQESSPPPATNTAPVTRTGRTSGDVGSGGLGIGATAFVSGLAGPEVVYDFGVWHLEGTLAFDHRGTGANGDGPSQTFFDFGVGGWYHLHLGENSDFSVGGAFGLATFSPGAGNSSTAFEIEPGAQIRAFITPNVALHGGLAFVFAFGDELAPLNKQFSLASNLTENLGFTYYFR